MKLTLLAIVLFGLSIASFGEDAGRESVKAKAPKSFVAMPSFQPDKPASGTIRVDGNLEDMGKLLQDWMVSFGKVQPRVKFSLDEVHNSTGRGVRALLAGVPSDITLTGRRMRPVEESAFVQKFGYEPTFIRVAGGSYEAHGKSPAPVFFVNKANPLARLSLDQLDAIYSTTRNRGITSVIDTWGQLGLNGEWADRRIHLYGLNQAAGTWTFLRDRLLLGGEFRNDIERVKYVHEDADWNEMIHDVANDPAGIGVASLLYVKSNPNVKPLALAEKDGGPYYLPTLPTVENHLYPLSRFVYITLNLRPGTPLDPRVKSFLEFVLSREGQEAVRQEGEFLPLPASLVRQERAQLR